MSSSEDDLLIACVSFVAMKSLENNKFKKRKKRRWWITSLYRNRCLHGGSILLQDLQKEDNERFLNCCRMSPSVFNQLLALIEPKIKKEDTRFRKAIPPAERMALTLRYLATGDSFASLALLFRISKSAISSIIPEVCTAIIEKLQDYIKVTFSIVPTR